MSETKKITCTKCGAKVETTGTGDFTTLEAKIKELEVKE
ncbi:MAG: hypothetical protein XD75_0581 [Parcubacteria bacterium 33_209]|nr:MAG: hypothetical protein XD75_0581 [Parcubacteria bacterium 33_209]